MSGKYLIFDIETHNAGKQWGMTPREFFRLGQYAWDDGPVKLTTDYDEMIEVIRSAPYVVGHNIISYDLSVLFGTDSIEPLRMGQDRRVIDTLVLASLLTPAPYSYTDANGHTYYDAAKPAQAMKYFGLENLCFQFGIQGKFGDLKELAKKHNPPGTLVRDLDFGLIPLDDPDFLAYADQDVVAVRDLFKHLMRQQRIDQYDSEYLWRELELASVLAQVTRNGIRPNTELAHSRVAEQQELVKTTLDWLVAEFDFPTEGKQPWKSAAGKDAILDALKSYGITPSHPDWTKTAKGAPSFSGDTMKAITEGTEAERLGEALAGLQGLRSIPSLILESTTADGRMHPDITMFQRSGRFCLPETHRVLTRRGILPVDEVKEGDETLDMRNRWVKITGIHRYGPSEVHTYETRSSFLESTPEHRWVQTSETGKDREVVPLDPSKRRILQLTPDAYPFDPKETYLWSDMTERERTAALVGLLVTDGHAAHRTDSGGSRFRVYQSESKFYTQLREFLGEWVTSDCARSEVNPHNPVHEMSLDTVEVDALLSGEGLEWENGLRNSETLMPWLLTLNTQETLAFLTAAYLSDGTISEGGVTIATNNPNLVKVFQLAAYRCGRRSNYREYENKKTGYISGRVALTRDRVSTRNLEAPSISHQPVWCVETETGTFTAWAPEGRWAGPYLTGNSVTRPGVTVINLEHKDLLLADEGKVCVELDFSNADARVVAAVSGDREFAKRFETDADGNDLHDGHNLSGEAFFGKDEYYAHEDEHGKPALRPVAKAATHAIGYGIGKNKLAVTLSDAAKKTGLDREFSPEDAQDIIDAYHSSYPLIARWKERVVREGDEVGYVTNPWGRRMPIDFAGATHKPWESDAPRSRSYSQSPALHGQSGTREMMADALIRLARRGEKWARCIRSIIHDALVVDLPEETVAEDVQVVVECMEAVFDPKTREGMPLNFPVGVGPLDAKNWKDGAH